MKCYPLTRQNYALLALLLVIGYAFTEVQHYFISQDLRPFTYLLAIILLHLVFFMRVKPGQPMELAKYLAVLLGIAVAVIIIIEDVIIRKNVSYTVAIVFFGAVVSPLVAGYIYSLLAQNKK
ncbi:MAG: hypothetical protein NTZ37_08650 [Methanoregula sp.]|nr:hypothetical protein [Methanoregula sp.]